MEFTALLGLAVARRRVGTRTFIDSARPDAFTPYIGVALPFVRGKNLKDLLGTAQITAIDDAGVHVSGFTHEQSAPTELVAGGSIQTFVTEGDAHVVTAFRLAAFSTP